MTQTSYALVTGASRGLGKYFARALAARQQNLVLVARDNERLATLAVELEKTHGIRAETLALDLASVSARIPCVFSSSTARVARRSLSRATSTRFCCRAASARAKYLPRPRDAPVTRA